MRHTNTLDSRAGGTRLSAYTISGRARVHANPSRDPDVALFDPAEIVASVGMRNAKHAGGR